MEHMHDEQFCLNCVVNEIKLLLPHQGPIKDFIHQNTLQAFIDQPFDEAVESAAKIFGARTYMPLHYYRTKFKEGSISNIFLKKSIYKHFAEINDNDYAIINHALFNWIEIIDRKTLFKLIKIKNLPIEDANIIIANQSPKRTTIHEFLNIKLGCPIEHEVNTILFRLLGAYLDQGVTLWPLMENQSNFKQAVLYLLEKSAIPLASFVKQQEIINSLSQPSEQLIISILSRLFKQSNLYKDYLQESLLDHPGWSGMINVLEKHPDSLAKPRYITVLDMLAVKLSLVWQFINHNNNIYLPISNEDLLHENIENKIEDTNILSGCLWMLSLPSNLVLKQPLQSHINTLLLQRIWQYALEQEYYHEIANKFYSHPININNTIIKKFQAIFCIDDRECSFRRYLESESEELETFSYPGFFGIDCYFKPHKKDMLEKLCPAPVTPKHVVMEKVVDQEAKYNQELLQFASFISRHGANSILFGFISAYTLGHLSLFQLLLSFFQPLKLMKSKQLSEVEEEKTILVFERDGGNPEHQGLFLGYTPTEMADRVFNVLNSIGLNNNFSPIVFLIAHGSSSVNNPHFAAYDCGACSGRPGGINARIFAAMANMPAVRKLVRDKGLTIPDDTWFVGGIHDTCTDHVKFFDLDKLPKAAFSLVCQFSQHVKKASELNALERCKKFALVPHKISSKQALTEVEHRAKALFEPRPELGHATNAVCIVGRRKRSFKQNFDRRAFLQSYDPTIDRDGSILAAIMSAVVPVCGGINLEYFFSRVDPAVYGCGTKLSHNVCSLIGVGNGLDDDLRTGLPVQMTEIHDPIRLLIVIEQAPDIILQVINANQSLRPWVINEWLKIASLCPNSNQMSLYEVKQNSFINMQVKGERQC